MPYTMVKANSLLARQMWRTWKGYFHNLYQSQGQCEVEMVSLLPTSITDELIKYFTKIEIKDALKNMGNFKALGPIGYHAYFYKETWSFVGDLVLTFFKKFHDGGTFCQKLNHTHIVLIPKIAHATKPKHFHPICLTYVIYIGCYPRF